jgi:hypothetical protein
MKYLVNRKTKEHKAATREDLMLIKDFGTNSDVFDLVEADSEGWIPHTGTECPLPDDAKCEVKFGNGVTIIWQPADRCWWNNSALKAYRPILTEKVQEPEPEPDSDDGTRPEPPPADYGDDLVSRLKAAHAQAQTIPDLEAELREVLGSMGYDLVTRSPFFETEAHGTDAAVKDALIYGTSVMRGGKYTPIQDFYVAPEQTVEPPQDMSDWRNWREGDLLLCVKGGVDLKEGNFYYISTRRHKLCVIDDDDCDRVLGLIDHNFLFHSRPAKGE